ncbi:Flp pilus assembly protein, protease CpaA [Thermanaeromonas toyohensis ToBE]|uniref:Flp pilus assembly protein, protease CpaA n=1 Tax=Thermanaeromonas toyohensis ToBE TaxID=698762 RepID=A0A1W1VTE8_9FIRM|nr:prepilin peptidase [Thermanaeromonas toyohensis]SMB96510.1 Flp pilus assembly protein, protease CpaA [Thermanaeromonas toyohensis ToBE]
MQYVLYAAAIVCLAWAGWSDARRMEVPVLPVAVLFCLGFVRVALLREWYSLAVPLVTVVLCVPLYLRRGMAEGDLLTMLALTGWFNGSVYAVIVAVSFAAGAAWGVIRLQRAGELGSWLKRVSAGVWAEVPDTSENGLKCPACVPMVSAIALVAGSVMIVRMLGMAVGTQR